MPSSIPQIPFNRHVSLPGILRETIQRRRMEFGYASFPPFALELICFDLRKRREHIITRAFADDTPAVREALDRELVRQYKPGNERRGLLFQALFCDFGASHRSEPRGSFAADQNHVSASAILQPCIELRWRELGYRSFSAYLTGLIRYDLMLLGPHKYFNGADKDPEILAALDIDTAETFHANIPQRLYLDELIEFAAGRSLTDVERAGIMRRIAAHLRERAMQPRCVAENNTPQGCASAQTTEKP